MALLSPPIDGISRIDSKLGPSQLTDNMHSTIGNNNSDMLTIDIRTPPYERTNTIDNQPPTSPSKDRYQHTPYYPQSILDTAKRLVTPIIAYFPSILSHSIYNKILENKNSKFIIGCLAWYITASLNTNLTKQLLTECDIPVTLTLSQFIGSVGFLYFYCHIFNFATLIPSSRALTKMVTPLAVAKVATHYLSSVAISHAPVSLVHTIKSLSPLFVVLFYRIFHNTRYSKQTVVSLCILTFGVGLTCYRAANLTIAGFSYAFLGCICVVILTLLNKWVLQKTKSSDTNVIHTGGRHANDDGDDKIKGLNNISIIYHTSALSIILMSPFWIFSGEIGFISQTQPDSGNGHVQHLPDSETLSTVGIGYGRLGYLLILGCSTSFLQSVLSINLLSSTNAVSYSIASLFKRIFVIVTAILWFNQPITLIQFIGISFTFVGLYLYDKAKLETRSKDKYIASTNSSAELPLAHNSRDQ